MIVLVICLTALLPLLGRHTPFTRLPKKGPNPADISMEGALVGTHKSCQVHQLKRGKPRKENERFFDCASGK